MALMLCLCSCLLFSLEPLPPANPNLLSSSCLTTLTDDPSNTCINPISAEGGISTSTGFLHGMMQLNQVEVASVISYQNNSMYAGWQAMEDDDYSRQDIRFGVRYSYRFFRLGVGYKVLFDKIPGFGSEKDDRINTGIRLKHSNTTLDFGTEHRIPYAENEDFSTGIFSLCIGQKLDDKAALAAGMIIANRKAETFKLGCRYQMTKNFGTIVSWDSEPGRFGIGTVFTHNWLKISYGMRTHPELDWTHSIGITAVFR